MSDSDDDVPLLMRPRQVVPITFNPPVSVPKTENSVLQNRERPPFSNFYRFKEIGSRQLNAYKNTHEKFPLGAVAELVDNAREAATQSQNCTLKIEMERGGRAMSFTDDGSGMDLNSLYLMMRPAQGTKGRNNFGLGFKTGTMGLGAEALVLTNDGSFRGLAFLSRSSNKLDTDVHDNLCIPFAFWHPDGRPATEIDAIRVCDPGSRSTQQPIRTNDVLENRVLKYIYESRGTAVAHFDALRAEFEKIGSQGTRIIVWMLHRPWISEDDDILLTQKSGLKYIREDRHGSNFPAGIDVPPDYSLKSYFQILFLQPHSSQSCFTIILQGHKIVPHDPLSPSFAFRAKEYRFELADIHRPGQSVSVVVTLAYSPQDYRDHRSGCHVYWHDDTSEIWKRLALGPRLVQSYMRRGTRDQSGTLDGIVARLVLTPRCLSVHNGKQTFDANSHPDNWDELEEQLSEAWNDFGDEVVPLAREESPEQRLEQAGMQYGGACWAYFGGDKRWHPAQLLNRFDTGHDDLRRRILSEADFRPLRGKPDLCVVFWLREKRNGIVRIEELKPWDSQFGKSERRKEVSAEILEEARQLQEAILADEEENWVECCECRKVRRFVSAESVDGYWTCRLGFVGIGGHRKFVCSEPEISEDRRKFKANRKPGSVSATGLTAVGAESKQPREGSSTSKAEVKTSCGTEATKLKGRKRPLSPPPPQKKVQDPKPVAVGPKAANKNTKGKGRPDMLKERGEAAPPISKSLSMEPCDDSSGRCAPEMRRLQAALKPKSAKFDGCQGQVSGGDATGVAVSAVETEIQGVVASGQLGFSDLHLKKATQHNMCNERQASDLPARQDFEKDEPRIDMRSAAKKARSTTGSLKDMSDGGVAREPNQTSHYNRHSLNAQSIQTTVKHEPSAFQQDGAAMETETACGLAASGAMGSGKHSVPADRHCESINAATAAGSFSPRAGAPVNLSATASTSMHQAGNWYRMQNGPGSPRVAMQACPPPVSWNPSPTASPPTSTADAGFPHTVTRAPNGRAVLNAAWALRLLTMAQQAPQLVDLNCGCVPEGSWRAWLSGSLRGYVGLDGNAARLEAARVDCMRIAGHSNYDFRQVNFRQGIGANSNSFELAAHRAPLLWEGHDDACRLLEAIRNVLSPGGHCFALVISLTDFLKRIGSGAAVSSDGTLRLGNSCFSLVVEDAALSRVLRAAAAAAAAKGLDMTPWLFSAEGAAFLNPFAVRARLEIYDGSPDSSARRGALERHQCGLASIKHFGNLAWRSGLGSKMEPIIRYIKRTVGNQDKLDSVRAACGAAGLAPTGLNHLLEAERELLGLLYVVTLRCIVSTESSSGAGMQARGEGAPPVSKLAGDF